MKLKIILIISIFSFLAKNKVHAQTINIRYHLGYDCGKEMNGKELKGGCVTNEKMKYFFNKNRKYFKSNKLEIQRDFRQYEKEDSKDYLQKKIISEWTKNTFELNRREIRKIKKFALKENSDLHTDSLIQKMAEYIQEENSGILVSSVVEFLNISFKYKEKEYSVSQNNLGEVNVSWQIKINDKSFFVISPELNKIIDSFISKKMRAKKRINQFMKIEELEKAFIKNSP